MLEKKDDFEHRLMEMFKTLSNLEEVEAIAIGGSRAVGKADAKSDYDIYVYLSGEISPKKRKEVLKEYCDDMEINNHYWELEDNCVLKNGVDIDLVYRNLDSFLEQVADVVENHHPRNGYTTCMWFNLLTCKVIYDANHRLSDAKVRFAIQYPEELKANIISHNMNLLTGRLPSYDKQIHKAVKRKDMVSINHRVTEFLSSYFDILFAVNELPHPGEKRLVTYCKERCRILPSHFEDNLNRLFVGMFMGMEMIVIEDIISELKKVI